jgi:hypothetical protein
MPKVNIKEIKEDCDKMSAGWEQSPETEFNGIKKDEFDDERAACTAKGLSIAIKEAALKAEKDEHAQMYVSLNGKKVKVGKGVAGHKDFGTDSPIYGAMGFVRDSERKSGLHRNTKPDDENK